MHRGEWAADSGNGRKWEAGKRVEEVEEGEFKPAFETSQTPYSDLAYLLSRSTIDRWLLTKERLSLLLPSLSPFLFNVLDAEAFRTPFRLANGFELDPVNEGEPGGEDDRNISLPPSCSAATLLLCCAFRRYGGGLCAWTWMNWVKGFGLVVGNWWNCCRFVWWRECFFFFGIN